MDAPQHVGACVIYLEPWARRRHKSSFNMFFGCERGQKRQMQTRSTQKALLRRFAVGSLAPHLQRSCASFFGFRLNILTWPPSQARNAGLETNSSTSMHGCLLNRAVLDLSERPDVVSHPPLTRQNGVVLLANQKTKCMGFAF